MLFRQLGATAAITTVLTSGALGCMPPPPHLPGLNSPSAASANEQPVAHLDDQGQAAHQQSAPPSEEQAWAERYAGQRALKVLRGRATYYGDSLAGNKTASGEIYNPRAFTAAHKTLPFGTIVRVVRTDRDTPRFVYVRITDRGPFGERARILDVSKAAAEQLDMIRDGVVEVRVEVVAYPENG